MTVPFQCPYCGHHTEVDEGYAGQSGPCAQCGRQVTVPRPEKAPLPAGQETFDSPPSPASERRGMSWAGRILLGAVLLVCFSCVFFVGYAVIRSVSLPPTVTTAQTCQNNILRILAALDAYHNEHGTYPPAVLRDEQGRPLHSWRVLVLPYLGQDERLLYEQIDLEQPWDAAANSIALGQMPEVYGCPDDSSVGTGLTSYMVVIGEGFAFNGKAPTTRSQIRDMPSDTILVVETAFSEIAWMEPRDILYEELADASLSGITSNHDNGAHVGVASGQVKTITPWIDPDEFKALFTINGGETVPVW